MVGLLEGEIISMIR